MDLNLLFEYLTAGDLQKNSNFYQITNKENKRHVQQQLERYISQLYKNHSLDTWNIQEIRNLFIQLKQTNLELKAAVGSSYDGIWITDGDGNTLFVNKAIERITGLKAEQVVGKNMGDLVNQGIFNISATLEVLKQRKTVTVMQKVNTGIETIVTGNPIFDENGSITRIISNVRDITELNKLKEKIEIIQEKNLRYYSELRNLKLKFEEMNNIIFRSPIMSEVVDKVIRLAQFDTTTLLLGETGVGKEVIAQLIHESSSRKETGSFIRVNCSALPHHLLESELFGYQGGAFTGADPKGKKGMFELADEGTIFLDEIGDLPLNIQVKFLRVLQESEILKLGGTKPIKINARIIAATNQNLSKMVERGEFRKDLYYRLNVVPIEIPPLRKRKEDILPLVQHFLNYFNRKFSTKKKFSPDLMETLVHYSWPGNVRELKNIVERLIVTVENNLINTEHLPSDFFIKQYDPKKGKTLKEIIEKVERDIISQYLNQYKSTYKAAKSLGISQSTMVRKSQKYGLNKT